MQVYKLYYYVKSVQISFEHRLSFCAFFGEVFHLQPIYAKTQRLPVMSTRQMSAAVCGGLRLSRIVFGLYFFAARLHSL